MVAEKVTGQRYAELVRQSVLEPLGMKDTGYDEPDLVLPARASGYRSSVKGLVHAPFLHMSWPFSAGALYSTVEDLQRLDEALYRDKLLKAELRKKMFTSVHSSYGYGWDLNKRFHRDCAGHNGGIPGFRSSMLRFPDEHLFVAVLTNAVGPVRAEEVAEDLAAMALGLKKPAPAPK
jgi:CubicO group peptidase (beta-lactamase class C family)